MAEIRDKLQRFSWRMERWLVPGLGQSHAVYERTIERFVGPETRWLDLGCGHQLLPAWRRDMSRRLTGTCKLVCGIDADWSSLVQNADIRQKVRGDILLLPFRGGQFDLVSANMVVEHLSLPSVLWREVYRVLRPGGIFVFQTPNLLGYSTLLARMLPRFALPRIASIMHGRREDDVYPTRYRANTPRAIHRLSQAADLRVRELSLLLSPPEFVILPPLLVPELVWIRLLSSARLGALRTRIVGVIERPALAGRADSRVDESIDGMMRKNAEPMLLTKAC